MNAWSVHIFDDFENFVSQKLCLMPKYVQLEVHEHKKQEIQAQNFDRSIGGQMFSATNLKFAIFDEKKSQKCLSKN